MADGSTPAFSWTQALSGALGGSTNPFGSAGASGASTTQNQSPTTGIASLIGALMGNQSTGSSGTPSITPSDGGFATPSQPALPAGGVALPAVQNTQGTQSPWPQANPTIPDTSGLAGAPPIDPMMAALFSAPPNS